MSPELLEKLKEITEEEHSILNGRKNVRKELYTTGKNFVVDCAKLLEKSRLIEIRPHTRFIRFPKHRHNYVEMIYMCTGTTTHIINDTEEVLLKPGDILLLNQNAVHEILPAAEEDIAVNFIILPEFFDRAMKMLEEDNLLFHFVVSTLSDDGAMSNYLHFSVKDALPVQNLVENMIWNLLHKKSQTNTINQVSMGLLFLNLLNFADTINQEDKEQFEQNLVFSALKYIKSNYKNGTLEDFCSRTHQKPYAMSRLLKKYTGGNFKELLLEQKLKQAAYLLSKTTLPAEAVFHAVGYENSSFFYRKFKEKYNMSPREFRKAQSLCKPSLS